MTVRPLLIALVVTLPLPATAAQAASRAAVPDCGRKYTHQVAGKIKVIMQRRGGGVTNGKRWIGYYVETQVPLAGAEGVLNRTGARGVHQRTWGKQYNENRYRWIQNKVSWTTPGKNQWEVHYNIKLEPGSQVRNEGQLIVAGYNGYVAAAWFSCWAR
ncbi:hypothetical protein [Nonomuraea aridisoli]|uniref:Uncharacterized protein n=1 Tax=Nonomuraea aridisoli TaxID=2070368 RepID=A0A2W2EVD2_9ACTN|nr:hypothetical protein [Nonomuraea aridisoli]PZG16408.1 hypothetical protein C1J01_21165 [Nonomuraea aridisoli]